MTDDIIHPTSPADLLRTPIADICRAAGHDELAESMVSLADWIDLVRPHVLAAKIAGEDIRRGDFLSRGPDGLLYRTRSPVQVASPIGRAGHGARKGESLTQITYYSTRSDRLAIRSDYAAWVADGRDVMSMGHRRGVSIL